MVRFGIGLPRQQKEEKFFELDLETLVVSLKDLNDLKLVVIISSSVWQNCSKFEACGKNFCCKKKIVREKIKGRHIGNLIYSFCVILNFQIPH